MKRKQLALALAVIGIGAHAPFALADNAGELDRVEVTGSNIKRSIKQEKALPVSIIRTEEMTKQGFTTVEQVVNSLASNQSSTVGASSVQSVSGGAAYASLRGLGSQYTLVLLDGRRVASQAISGIATDLNAIPLAAIERIEVLRDGASAIYGTDAIGGVINFITKKRVDGLTIGGEALSTQHRGGNSGSVNLLGGVGDLSQDGWNVYGALSYQKTQRITTPERSFAYKNLTADNLSPAVYPANFIYKGNVYNPAAPKCQPPYAQALDANSCGEMSTLFMDLTPEVEQMTALAKGSKRIGDHELSLQYLGARNISTTHISPTPLAKIATLVPGDKYYPTTLPDGTKTDGSKVILNARSVPLGPRTTKSTSDTQRLAFNAEGLLGGWDYRGGAVYSENKTTINYKDGYANETLIRQAFKDGTINPFGDSAPGAWDSVRLFGDGWIAKYTTALADFKASKELFSLPAGMVAGAFGAEMRHEKLDSQIQALASNAIGSGIANSQSTSGQRNVSALYAEAEIPVLKGLELQIASRFDHYNDFGNSFNPKVAFKYQPAAEVLFRGSASKGFRAPSLYDVFQPDATTYTADKFNDPVRCPGGTPANGGNKAQDCNQQFMVQQGGNRHLNPEKASSLTFGIVIEPTKSLTASADFWWTMVQNTIGVLDPGAIFADPAKYADRFVRNADGSLDYVKTPTENLGNLSAAGVDLSLAYRFPKTAAGNFGVNLDGTYTSKYVQQLERGGAYYSPLGGWYQNILVPTLRWKHSLAFSWSKANWSAQLVQNYSSGYTDMNPNDEAHNVKSYSNWNLSGTYLWNKKLTVTAGVKNLFDQEPPFSNQTKTFQFGYDPVLADSIGRAYFLKASYKL
ncbi:TonB-dependent receptor [Chromobacterium alticapitis]|uniref:TonB-dependent receptor n=1 Tax=Chromobacterium alticapitis TaxID=2073169 RepID=A0A2S5DAG7_9NEIS|nr:TonB-dependent receptor [Chromobacterium alticapitis]POZ59992.1 TonB-dependent receptor [Chromobacterium alticapitis]